MDVKKVVKEKYGEAALRVISGKGSASCGSSPSCCSATDIITGVSTTVSRRGIAGDGRAGLVRLRQSDGAGRVEAGETVLDLGQRRGN